MTALVPADAYGTGLLAASDGVSADDWLLRYSDGTAITLALKQWLGHLKPGDASLVERCHGVTLDVGCGPGRLAAAVASRGQHVLGLDIAPVAVQLTRERGVTVLRGSVFDHVPGEGHWDAILLADGNIGIGGKPARLLRRCAELATCDGVVLIETDAPGSGTRPVQVRIESTAGVASGWFPWAHVAHEAVEDIALASGFVATEHWSEHGRWFATLRRDC